MRTLFPPIKLNCETLEVRTVPSAALPDVDLTTHGSIGTIDGAIFSQCDAQPTGTGFIDSFVRLQAKGAGAQAQEGFNTDARPLQFDENKSPQFTRSLRLSDVPEVEINGVRFREFLLDINQKASQPLLSLDGLRIYLGAAGNLTGLNKSTGQLAGLTAVFDMDASGDHWVKLNSRLNQGSGKGDMVLLVPSSSFAGAGADAFVYLYSRFGDNLMPNAGFEEWAVARGGVTGGVPSSVTNGQASISGRVTNTLGVGVADVVVFLDTNHNGVLDTSELYTVTDMNGDYSFSHLVGGLGDYSTFDVRVVVPTGSSMASPDDNVVTLATSDTQLTGVDFALTSEVPLPS